MVIGVCGFVATGSSAVSDLLKEFDETQVIDSLEFSIAYTPDGLEDLEYHLNKFSKQTSSVVAINRFRKRIHDLGALLKATNGKSIKIANKFLSEIVSLSWEGSMSGSVDKLFMSKYRRKLRQIYLKLHKRLKLKRFPLFIKSLFNYKLECSILPPKFDEASRDFINNMLKACNCDDDKIIVLDQPFDGSNPVKSFKYFDSPKAIIVDRDPRDLYLFAKVFLENKMLGRKMPSQNVDDFIKYYKLVRQGFDNIKGREDILFMNFEELIYNYDEAIKKVSIFCNVSNHVKKGDNFNPHWSRNNTQLFKKYHGFENDVQKIEYELPEYLFRFDNFHDVEAEGSMFFGNMSRRGGQ
ncbi:sulfotransferase family protein [Clostridia bacterium]|nr:sulfotransferase family protein [Clostridia bacterium]